MNRLIFPLLRAIISHPNLSLKELAAKLQLSRSQLDYQLTQANKFLNEQQQPPIVRQHQQLSSQLSLTQLESLINLQAVEQPFYLTKKNRRFVLPILLFRGEQLQLAALADHLTLSKNTIVADLAHLKNDFSQQGLQLNHTKKNGYYVTGSELAYRTLMAQSLMSLITQELPLKQLLVLFDISEPHYQQQLHLLTAFQHAISSRFSDIYENFLIFLTLLIKQRSDNQHHLTDFENQSLLQIMTHTDYQFIFTQLITSKLLTDHRDGPFYAIHILSANVIASKRVDTNDRVLVTEVIQRFEKSMALTFVEKEQLIALLAQHLKPAIYRLKYGRPYEDYHLLEFSADYQTIYFPVKAALAPIETFFKIKFNYTETMYIVLLFHSFMTNNQQLVQKKWRALVICQRGIAVSRLLFEDLRHLLPLVEFITHMSVKDYYQQRAEGLEVELIFSTSYVTTTKKLFIVKPLLNQTDKEVLQRDVNYFIGGFDSPKLDLTELLTLIQKNADITNSRELKKDLVNYLYPQPTLQVLPTSPRLANILQQEDIHFTSRKLDFAEAIRLVGQPLIQRQTITQTYLDTIINEYNPAFPYFMIAPQIAIPHASPTNGVNHLSMSLLRLTHGVSLSATLSATLFLLIAPIDNHLHQEALLNFYQFVHVPRQHARLMACRSKEALYSLLQEV